MNRIKVSLVGIALMPTLPFHLCGGLSKEAFYACTFAKAQHFTAD